LTNGQGFQSNRQFTLGYICRDYPHKNVDFLLPLGFHLDAICGVGKFRLLVTLNDQEWSSKSFDFKSRIENVGALRVSDCPGFYSALDGVVFPSQLECFSATPIEAMFMRVPVFSSNLRFISDIFGDKVVYIDLDDPLRSAKIISSWFGLSFSSRSEFTDRARAFVEKLPSAKSRAREYLKIIYFCFSR
jgi:glycosyltransferase involved in cell wall biosynthesis